ncbi:MAG: hypothetical protein H0T92_12295, partial [Pyrinomonadaceae bacterium]|nr:hypothetical protein [Pyrinomonadaceae bacterium]
IEQTDKRAEQQTTYEASPAVRARRERLESLTLARARTLAQLQHAVVPAYREMLERALRTLEAEISELS